MLTPDQLGKHNEEMRAIFDSNKKDPDRALRIMLGNIKSRFNEGDYTADTAGQLHGMAVDTYHQEKARLTKEKSEAATTSKPSDSDNDQSKS
jgi:hypothetical protein